MSVRVVQDIDGVGEPAPMVCVEHIRQAKALQRWPDAVMGFLRGLRGRLRGLQPGAYAYRDPARGSGLLHVEGADPLQLMRIDELVQMVEIERATGKDPTRYEDMPGIWSHSCN